MFEIKELFTDAKKLPILPALLLELMDSFSNDKTQVDDIAKKVL